MNSRERHFFLHDREKHIYTVEYLPDGNQGCSHGIVLFKPIWGERIRTHIIFSNLARCLSNKGFTVITYDYFGDGNSGGESSDLNYSSMTEDAEIVIRYLQQNFNLKRYSFVGLRLGANVAMSVAANVGDLHKLVLFEPILNPIELFNKALMANLTTQMAIHKKIIKNRKQLIQDIKENKFVNIDGFVIGREFWESFEKISPFTVKNNFDEPVVIYSLVPPRKKGNSFIPLAGFFSNSVMKSMEQEFDWTGWKSYVPKPGKFFEAIDAELEF